MSQPKPPIDVPITIFLISVPVLSLILAPLYWYFETVSWQLLLFALVFAAATNLSITAGYHRLLLVTIPIGVTIVA